MTRYLPIIFAIVAGTLSVLPYIVAYTVVEPIDNQKLPYFYQDSELVYLTRIREITEGNLSASSPVFAEYKDTKGIQQPFGEWLYALLSLGNPAWVTTCAMVSKFVFPAALFYLVYILVLQLLTQSTRQSNTSHTLCALCIATLVILGFEFTNAGFWHQILTHNFDVPILSIWTRLVNPITGALGLMASFYLLLTMHTGRSDVRIIIAGVVLGTMSGYIFSFALGVVSYCLFLLVHVCMRAYIQARHIFYALCIAFVINIPYFSALAFTHADPATLTKNGLLFTHAMLHNKVLYLTMGIFVLAALGVYMLKREWKTIVTSPVWQWSFVVLVSSFICLNQQVVTGKTVWPGHFVQYTNPLCYVVLGIILYTVLMAMSARYSSRVQVWCERIVNIGSVVAICFILAVNILTIFPAYAGVARYTEDQRYAPALSWITENAEEQCSVFVLEQTEWMEKFITAYTPCDLYISSYTFFGVPEERVLHNYVVKLRLLGIAPENVVAHLEKTSRDLNRYFFEDWIDIFPEEGNEWVKRTKSEEAIDAFIPKTIGRVASAYRDSSSIPTHTLLEQYAITYIVVDTHTDSDAVPASLYPKVFEADGITIFETR